VINSALLLLAVAVNQLVVFWARQAWHSAPCSVLLYL